MVSATFDTFSAREASDRNFFLLILAAIWAGVIAGFIPDTLDHVTGKHVAFAPIVHVHAVSYLAWLALLTTQMSLIRSGRVALHRRLGPVALVMIPWMVVVGAWAALVMGHREFGTPDGDAAFIILPFANVIAFACVTAGGLAFRADAPTHKRLMLIGTIALSNAGFARWIGPWLGPFLAKLYGRGFATFHLPHFICGDVLLAAIVVHDLATRRRVQPVVGAAVMFVISIEVLTTLIYFAPAWTPIATKLIGR